MYALAALSLIALQPIQQGVLRRCDRSKSKRRDKLVQPASVAQWKSSSVLRKGLGVRVPPGAPRMWCEVASVYKEIGTLRRFLLMLLTAI